MELLNQITPIIKIILDSHFPKDNYTIKGGFNQILGGADTEIFSFTVMMLNEPKSKHLIIRIYRDGATIELSRREFETLDQLYKAGLSVPKPYGFTGPDNALRRPFIIMEKIEGELLSDLFYKRKDESDRLIEGFVQNLVKIHDLKWQEHFPNRINRDIESDPYQLFTSMIDRVANRIEPYNIEELQPLITWLRESMKDHPCTEVVLVHGDYHGMNVMVKENGDFVTLDWMDIKLGDRRQDIAFSIVAMDSASSESMKEYLIKIYENVTETKIEGIEFFMVLSALYNLIRVYSMLFNYEITGENDMTKATMIGGYIQFVNYFVNMIKEVTGLNFPLLEAKLENDN